MEPQCTAFDDPSSAVSKEAEGNYGVIESEPSQASPITAPFDDGDQEVFGTKCDVCKESFTQKNILLVHFNSVSHLHKMKKFLKENQENPNNLTPQSEGGSPSSPLAPGSTLMSVLGSLNAKKQLEPDNELKPYKCNICQVSYAQGSTLDIHIRSVLHHTRANKLQELVLTGHVDLSKPLIENPDNADEANNSEIELFSPKSLW